MPTKIWSFLLYLAFNCWPHVRYEANESKNSLEHCKFLGDCFTLVTSIGTHSIFESLYQSDAKGPVVLLKMGSCKIFAQRLALIWRLAWELAYYSVNRGI